MGDTGREVLRKDVKVRGWILFGIFSVIFVFMIITICSMIHNGEFELNSFTGPLIFLTVISVICIWDGIRMIRTPEKLLNREIETMVAECLKWQTNCMVIWMALAASILKK